MKTKLRRGFRKEAEEYSEEFREELGLEAHDPLDPRKLADHLEVPIHDLSAHPSIPDEVKTHFRGAGNSDFSATTIANGNYREIIHNDFQHPNRQASNIIHELSHIILGHPPRPPMNDNGHRSFDDKIEKEASELGFTLLIPKIAALYAIEAFRDLKSACEFYGVSLSLLQYRIRITNAHGWAENRARKAFMAE